MIRSDILESHRLLRPFDIILLFKKKQMDWLRRVLMWILCCRCFVEETEANKQHRMNYRVDLSKYDFLINKRWEEVKNSIPNDPFVTVQVRYTGQLYNCLGYLDARVYVHVDGHTGKVVDVTRE